jgi:hypothetical protein
LQDLATVPEWYAIATPEHRRAGQMAHTVEEKLELVAAQGRFVILPQSTFVSAPLASRSQTI